MAGKAKELQDSKYEVGYRRTPIHSRFQKGRSGNPGGRPRGMSVVRANTLVLKEAYRPVTVREGDKVVKMPAIQAVLRSQTSLAAKGNGPAQRAMLETVQTIERENAQVCKEETKKEITPMTETEIARGLAFALAKAAHEKERV
jgi:hypothetical protein